MDTRIFAYYADIEPDTINRLRKVTVPGYGEFMTDISMFMCNSCGADISESLFCAPCEFMYYKHKRVFYQKKYLEKKKGRENNGEKSD